jgi:diaphanous 1
MEVLTPSIVESLVNACPQETEIALYQNPDQLDSHSLAAPDLFFLEVSSIPKYPERLQAFLAEYNSQDLFDDLKRRIGEFDTSIRTLQSDNSMKTLFKYSLAFGNYLNGQGAKGGAFGFKFDSLLKSNDVKSNDGKKTLFMVIVEQAEKDLKRELFDAEGTNLPIS